jgi:hypothetical protein
VVGADNEDGGSVTTEPGDDSKAGMLAATKSEGWAEIVETSEKVREAQLEVERLIALRNDAIRAGIDLYHLSYRQAARASGLSSGRIHGILANE